MAQNGPVTAEQMFGHFMATHSAAPCLTTTKGNLTWGDAAEHLKRRAGFDESQEEICAWIEYYENTDLVHRSVHVHLKKPMVESVAETQAFG